VDGSVEKELEAINKRIETMLDIVLEHFGDSEDRFQGIEEKISALESRKWVPEDGS